MSTHQNNPCNATSTGAEEKHPGQPNVVTTSQSGHSAIPAPAPWAGMNYGQPFGPSSFPLGGWQPAPGMDVKTESYTAGSEMLPPNFPNPPPSHNIPYPQCPPSMNTFMPPGPPASHFGGNYPQQQYTGQVPPMWGSRYYGSGWDNAGPPMSGYHYRNINQGYGPAPAQTVPYPNMWPSGSSQGKCAPLAMFSFTLGNKSAHFVSV